MLAKDNQVIGFEEPENELPPAAAKVHQDFELDNWADFGFNDGFSRNQIIGAVALVLVAIAFIKWG